MMNAPAVVQLRPEAPRAFRLIAAGFLLGALVHVVEASIALAHHDATYPLWRHALFIVIDGTLSALAIVEPELLWLPLIVLLVQQCTTHGLDVVRTCCDPRELDWLSVATMLFVGLGAAFAVRYRFAAPRDQANP